MIHTEIFNPKFSNPSFESDAIIKAFRISLWRFWSYNSRRLCIHWHNEYSILELNNPEIISWHQLCLVNIRYSTWYVYFSWMHIYFQMNKSNIFRVIAFMEVDNKSSWIKINKNSYIVKPQFLKKPNSSILKIQNLSSKVAHVVTTPSSGSPWEKKRRNVNSPALEGFTRAIYIYIIIKSRVRFVLAFALKLCQVREIVGIRRKKKRRLAKGAEGSDG